MELTFFSKKSLLEYFQKHIQKNLQRQVPRQIFVYNFQGNLCINSWMSSLKVSWRKSVSICIVKEICIHHWTLLIKKKLWSNTYPQDFSDESLKISLETFLRKLLFEPSGVFPKKSPKDFWSEFQEIAGRFSLKY